MKKINYLKYIYNLAFKMAISATIALIIGKILGLQYATVGAVIAILSIQDTRKKALIIGYKRITACSIGILLSVILYSILGNSAISFGIFLLILIPITSRINVQEGMVPAVVLSTHFLTASNITATLIINELLLMIIGIGVAGIANTFMPSLEDKFKDDKEWIEEHYRIIIHKIAKSLITYSVDIDEQKLMDEIRQREDVILFIDEIHEIVGAGSAGEGNMDAGNILKPALARGELQLVGATTLNEYRIIEKDAALERRMQPVKVDEPTVEETITILKGIQKKYEDYHHVHYTDGAIEAAGILSNRYIQDRFLPDKAIDLLDEAGSKMNLTLNFVDPKVIDQRLIEAENLKAQATREEDFEKAAYFRDQIAKYKEMQGQHVTDQETPVISEKTIEHIVEQKTNIPVGDLKEKEQSQLINLAADLKAHVIGQDDAVDKIAKAIRRNRVGLGSPNRPIGSFLFVGPTGVGKTELSKQLAIELFGSADNMIRFDMSEYMEKHSVAKLVGAPPGYVGYDEAGQLTEKVRRNPYSLVLLDEVEKAHPDVMHMFLQVLDDGRLTDGQGHTVSFKDTIIIMTSNAGTGKAEANVGFGAAREGRTNSVLGELGNFFSPEFMNRFDGIIEFQPLSKENLLQIVTLMLDEVNQRLAQNEIHLDVTEKVKEKLVDLGYDPKMGARPLRRTIEDHIEDAITDYYLEHPSEKQLKAVLTSNGKISIKSAHKPVEQTTES